MPHRETFSDVQGGRPIINWAVTGNLLSDATQAGFEGISKALEVDLPPISRSDGGMEPYQDATEVKIKVESYQNTYAGIKRNILRCQAILDVVVQYGLDFYNFVAPNNLAMEFELDISSSDIIQTINYHGKILSLADWEALLTAATGASTGTTSGTTVTGLTREVFNDSEYETPSIRGIYFGTGSLAGLTYADQSALASYDELGLKEAAGTKLKISFVKVGDTLRMQPLTKRAEFKCTTSLFENRASDISRMAAASNTELNWVWVFSDFIIVFSKCMKYVGGPQFKDASGLVSGKLEGSTYLDPVNATATNVVFGDAGKVITFNQQGKVFA